VLKVRKVDMIRTVTLPHLHLFGIEEGLELQVSWTNLETKVLTLTNP
jgi:hypothetical protein